MAEPAPFPTQTTRLLRKVGGGDRDAAEALGIWLRSVERGWRTARAFLVRELGVEESADDAC